jgi:hypothetical protein
MSALYSKDFWREYDAAAEWCAKRGVKGIVGDSLPEGITDNVAREIYDDREAFERRVREKDAELAENVLSAMRSYADQVAGSLHGGKK